MYKVFSPELPTTYAFQVVKSVIFHTYSFKFYKTDFFAKAYSLKILERFLKVRSSTEFFCL